MKEYLELPHIQIHFIHFDTTHQQRYLQLCSQGFQLDSDLHAPHMMEQPFDRHKGSPARIVSWEPQKWVSSQLQQKK